MPSGCVYIASENKLVREVVRNFLAKAEAEGECVVNVWALHSEVHERIASSEHEQAYRRRRSSYLHFDSVTREKLLSISPDSGQNDQFGPPLIELVIGHRYLVTKNLFLDINVINGTTGVLVGLVYSSTDAHPIRVNASKQQAAVLQPQLPIAMIQVDEKFWKPEFNNLIQDLPGYPPRTIAIGPISSYLKMPMSGQRYLRSQLPLMSGKGFSEHKSQSMTIAGGVVLDMNCRHFAANGTYVAITRVETLSALIIVGRKLSFADFLVDQPCLQRIKIEYDRIKALEPDTLEAVRKVVRVRAFRRRHEFECFDE